MKRLNVTLTNFAMICILLLTSACYAATASTQTVGTDLAVIPMSTQQPPVTETNPVTDTSTPAGQKPARPTKTSKDSQQPTPGTSSSIPLVNPDFIATEILGRPTDTSITVNVIPAIPMEIYYEYGTAPGVYTTQTTPQTAVAGTPLETLIAELQPDTRYYYRIRYGSVAGQEHTFVTQRSPGSAFTFAIQGDSHPERVKKQFDPDLYTRTLLSAAADQPDFYITMGDDFSVDALKTVNAEIVRSLYVNQRRYLGLVGAPLFLVNGNHEQAALANLDGTPDNVAVWAQTARNAYFPQPAPDTFYTGDTEPVELIGQLRDYYAFTWGDALFVIIDPYWHSSQTVDNQFGADRNKDKKNRDLWNVTLGETQYQWFKHTLETSAARYKFVFAHHVNGTGRGGIELAGTYEWGDAANLAAHRPGWEKTIHQLMVDNHVTIFFQGHDHIFVRQELDGVIYQTLPTPADPNYAFDNAQAYLSGDKLPASGHVRVTVSPSAVTVDYIRSYLDQPNELAFSYTVSSNGQILAAASTPVSPAPEKTRSPGTPKQPQTPEAFPTSSYVPATSTFNLILGRPTADSIIASLLASTDQQIALAYGAQPGNYTYQAGPVSLQANLPQNIEITGLTPNTTYYYSILTNGISSEEHTFQTQRTPGNSFTFTIDADPHNRDPRFNGELYATTLTNALNDHPDFHINLGDTFMTEKLKPQTYAEAVSTFTDMRPYLGILGIDTPLFLVNGNHEGELGWLLKDKTKELPIWSSQLRQLYYPGPIPGAFYTGSSASDPNVGNRDGYYAWTWGDALFVVLDPFWYTPSKPKPDDPNNNWNWTLGKEQYDWLKSTLKTSDASFKFIFIHHLVGGSEEGRGGIEVASFYEWGGNNSDGSYGFDEQRPGWGKPIHQLLVENHVNAVFHGHDHVFVKQDLDGIVYQELPQPSNTEYNNTRLATDYGYIYGDVLSSSGHLRVTVTPTQVTIEYVRSYLPQDQTASQQNGQVDYTYAIVSR